MYGFIYCTTNLITGKKYIGQRKYKNTNSDNLYLGSGKILSQSILKHGKENFKKEILCECLTIEELNQKEEFYIKEFATIYPVGYNIAEKARGGDKMKFHPEKDEINKKRIQAVKKFNRDAVWCEKMAQMSKGRRHSPETIEKIKESKKKNPWKASKEQREKLSNKLKGRKIDLEVVEKIKNKLTGKKRPVELMEQIRQKLIGKKRSEEQKNTMKIAAKNRTYNFSEERIKQMSENSKKNNVLNGTKFICEYCNKEFGLGNYKRYHGINCKQK